MNLEAKFPTYTKIEPLKDSNGKIIQGFHSSPDQKDAHIGFGDLDVIYGMGKFDKQVNAPAVYILENKNGKGSLILEKAIKLFSYPSIFKQMKMSIAVADLNDDAVADIALTNCSNESKVFVNDSATVYITYGVLGETKAKGNICNNVNKYGINSIIGNIIKYQTSQDCEININLYNSKGMRLLRKKLTTTKAGFNKIVFDNKLLTKGIYILSFESVDGTFTRRFVY